MGDTEINCKRCRYYNEYDDNCKALACDGLSCDDPLPCEVDMESCMIPEGETNGISSI